MAGRLQKHFGSRKEGERALVLNRRFSKLEDLPLVPQPVALIAAVAMQVTPLKGCVSLW